MKNSVEIFIDNLEEELKHTESSYKKMRKTEVLNNSWQTFGFAYQMKNRDPLTFGIHYLGDFHIKHQFQISCTVVLEGELFNYKDPGFKKFHMKHTTEMEQSYQHFLTCFQKTLEHDSYFRLYKLTHSDMIINNIEKLLPCHEKELQLTSNKKNIKTTLQTWIQKIKTKRRNI